ncbi:MULTISPECIES: hypothetical protein [Amycolatopsis]|uniref:hypothetical protein n=1 Tax=Amycolatopsis TaxID=1813 RepID=UPI001F407C4D|nr:hypothetical protein [Amycolatopsis sp. WAC 04197]
MTTDPYAVPPHGQPATPEPYLQPRQSSRAVPRVISGLGGFLLTPVALGVTIYGGTLVQRGFSRSLSISEDPLGIILLFLGGLLLLGVAFLGALSGLGPALGGLVWGVLPGVGFLLSPRDVMSVIYDAGGSGLGVGLVTWLVMGALVGSGFLLIGAGLVGTLSRRRSNRV